MKFGVNAVFVSLHQISIIQAVLADINMKKGESECQYYIDKLEYLDDRQKDPRIEQCKSLLCHGELRNKSGTVSFCLPQRHTHNSLNCWGQITSFIFSIYKHKSHHIPNKAIRGKELAPFISQTHDTMTGESLRAPGEKTVNTCKSVQRSNNMSITRPFFFLCPPFFLHSSP